jgi:hypothetical protein
MLLLQRTCSAARCSSSPTSATGLFFRKARSTRRYERHEGRLRDTLSGGPVCTGEPFDRTRAQAAVAVFTCLPVTRLAATYLQLSILRSCVGTCSTQAEPPDHRPTKHARADVELSPLLAQHVGGRSRTGRDRPLSKSSRERTCLQTPSLLKAILLSSMEAGRPALSVETG